MRLFPRPSGRGSPHVVDVVVDKVGAYMIGNLVISLVAGVTTFVVLTVLGVPFALPLAVVGGDHRPDPDDRRHPRARCVTVAVTFVTTDLWPTTTVVVAIFFLVYQQLENYLIAPRVLRNTVDMSAVAVLLAGAGRRRRARA